MSTHRIQGLRYLRDEMKAVARRARPVQEDAPVSGFNSVEVLARSPTAENLRLPVDIRNRNPRSAR